jgi:hypothetical protein
VKPVELRADGFFLAGNPARPKAWLLLEVQTSVDKEKLRTIPLGLEMAQARYRHARGDVVLVSADEKVARYFDAHPFELRGPLGTRRSLSPVRIDLSRLPVRKLLAPGRSHLALLAVAAHRKGPNAEQVATRAAAAVARGDAAWQARMMDGILLMVDPAVRAKLEAKMGLFKGEYQYKTKFFRKAYQEGQAEGEAKGEAKGEARGEARGQAQGEARGEARGQAQGEARGELKGKVEALRRVIARKGLTLSAEMDQRIAEETDIARIDLWLEAAVTASSAADIFVDA